MSQVIPTKIEKCRGAMLATAIGDALGWPNEQRSKNKERKPKVVDHFVEWKRCSSTPRWHDETILPGEYSDDTQLTLSVARSIIAGDWEKFFSEKELPFWLEYERGGGSALLKAAKSCKAGILQWRSNNAPEYFDAGGNGAIMRILPHVIAAAKTPNIDKLMTDVVKNTLITHGHPRAFLGATCYAYALDFLLKKETVLEYGELVTAVVNGQDAWGANLNSDVFGPWIEMAKQHSRYDFLAEWENTRAHMVKQLVYIEDSLKKGLILDDINVLTNLECFGRANGAGDIAALAAIYLASRYANNPSLGLKVPAFSFGADTDTIASITGGLLGMLNGTNWIPTEWKAVQDYDCLIQMTELLLADNKKEATKDEVAELKARSDQWESTPIGKMRFVDSKSAQNGIHGVVIIEKWQTVLGQTLYKKFFKPNDSGVKYSQIDREGYQKPTIYDMISAEQRQVTKKEQQRVIATKQLREFVLTSRDISDLLGNPKFKKNITIGKILKIIERLIDGKSTSVTIAKIFNIEQSVVELINNYIKHIDKI